MVQKSNTKTAYICGPLTELPTSKQLSVKSFYEHIAKAYKEVMGIEAFVPHKHYDPIKYPIFLPQEVDKAERFQLKNNTSLLIVVAIYPSWGGGIEVEIANNNDIPVVIIQPTNKKISRLLRGNPAVKEIISYNNEEEAINALKIIFKKVVTCICPI